jgi:hypothetical protein
MFVRLGFGVDCVWVGARVGCCLEGEVVLAKTNVNGSFAAGNRLLMERRLEQNTFSRENSCVGGAKGDGGSKTEMKGKAAERTGK